MSRRLPPVHCSSRVLLAIAALALEACGDSTSSHSGGATGGANASAGLGGGTQTGGNGNSAGMAITGGVTATGGAGGSEPTGGTDAETGGATSGGARASSGGTLATGGVGAAAGADSEPEAGAEPGGSGGAGGSPTPTGEKRLTCPAGPFPAPMVVSTKSVCTNFAFNHTFNEGPTWIASQKAFFFTNFIVRSATGGDIIKYTPGGQCEVFISNVGCNGLAAATDGNLLAACHQSRSVIRFDLTTKQPTTLADGFMGMMLDTPNDLVQHSNGTIYFTNPNYELDGRPAGFGPATFRIDPAGTLSLIRQGSCNGIGLSPDQSKLYVLLSGMWDLDAQGVPSNRATLFTSGDGMAVDCAGNLYASGSIFSPLGQNLGSYGSGTNLAFGGLDGKTVLMVGGGTQVRELQMSLPGLP